jgi:hypothetical protein
MRFIILTLFLLINLEAKSLFSNSEQQQTSKYIDNLKDLIIATQKTRGLTNSYLNGNTAAMLLVYGTRDDMKKAIGNMEATALAADPVINSRATAISQALIKLNHKAFKRKPSEVFSAYTEQIGQTLMLAQSVSKRSAKDLTPFGKEISSVMMEVMLPMTEYTGQLRGLGSGIAAKGKITKENIENLQALAYELQSLNKKLQNKMIKITAKYPSKLSSNIINKIENIDKQVQDYIAFIQNKLIKNPKNVNPDAYFDKGTQLIASIVKVYDVTNQALLEDSKGWL